MNNLQKKEEEFIFNIVDVEQGTPEWLAFRKMGIGASDIATIMGINPHKTMYDLWREQTGRKKETEANYLMRRGTALEPVARAEAEKHFGVTLTNPVIQRKDIPWAIASLDGATSDFGFILESKSPHATTFNKVKKSQTIPEITYYQTQWQMYVSGGPEIMVQYHFKKDMNSPSESIYLPSKRDDDLIDLIYKAACEFRYYVTENIQPPLSEKTKLFMSSDKFQKKTEEWVAVKTELDILKKQETLLSKEVKDMTDGGACENDIVLVSLCTGRKTVDIEKLKVDFHISDETFAKYENFGLNFQKLSMKK